jgi:hypothetical protein
LTFQPGISKPKGRGGRRSLLYAFTEHGVAMLSSVLHSRRAVQMNLLIIRAFVHIRGLLATNKDLAARVERLEAGQKEHTSVIGASWRRKSTAKAAKGAAEAPFRLQT